MDRLLSTTHDMEELIPHARLTHAGFARNQHRPRNRFRDALIEYGLERAKLPIAPHAGGGFAKEQPCRLQRRLALAPELDAPVRALQLEARIEQARRHRVET